MPGDAIGANMARLRRDHFRMLGNGYCAWPPQLDCTFESVCENCTFFQTKVSMCAHAHIRMSALAAADPDVPRASGHAYIYIYIYIYPDSSDCADGRTLIIGGADEPKDARASPPFGASSRVS